MYYSFSNELDSLSLKKMILAKEHFTSMDFSNNISDGISKNNQIGLFLEARKTVKGIFL